jgi:hypothetical protein
MSILLGDPKTMEGREVNADSLWHDLTSEIRKQEPSGENPDEYVVFTKLKPKRNRIRVLMITWSAFQPVIPSPSASPTFMRSPVGQ